MSSFDKTVKLACKPKAAPPKAKVMPFPWKRTMLTAHAIVSRPNHCCDIFGWRIHSRCLSGAFTSVQRTKCYCKLIIRFEVFEKVISQQVVFKALIVLHTMIRNGSTDNVLSYLSSSPDVLRLHNVAAGQWEGIPNSPIRFNTGSTDHTFGQATMLPKT